MNSTSVRQYGKAVFLPRESRLRETANSRFIKYFCVYPLPKGSRLRETANSHRTKRLAVFFSPVERKTCSHFFEILFNAKTTFSSASLKIGFIGGSSRLSTKTPIFSMVFGEGERRRTIRTSSENSTKSTEIAVFWQGSFYSCLA